MRKSSENLAALGSGRWSPSWLTGRLNHGILATPYIRKRVSVGRCGVEFVGKLAYLKKRTIGCPYDLYATSHRHLMSFENAIIHKGVPGRSCGQQEHGFSEQGQRHCLIFAVPLQVPYIHLPRPRRAKYHRGGFLDISHPLRMTAAGMHRSLDGTVT